jgi:nucleotide-binding universal stress UspA family protein
MFKNILVPLDGSKLAECALPYAEELALNCQAEKLTLVSVTERVAGKSDSAELREEFQSGQRSDLWGMQGEPGPSYIVSSIGGAVAKVPVVRNSGAIKVSFGKMEKQADKYLHRIAAPLVLKGLPVYVEVLIGKVADSITAYAEENGFDVIVMSSHGRSGPSRWALGSVTDKVFRSSCIPVLMVRAPGCLPGM